MRRPCIPFSRVCVCVYNIVSLSPSYIKYMLRSADIVRELYCRSRANLMRGKRRRKKTTHQEGKREIFFLEIIIANERRFRKKISEKKKGKSLSDGKLHYKNMNRLLF